ncbi:MAG: tetratricopeptide repeat protein [Labilithrix sp.]|nr:tetratricopeptide repeat protein [Labilithrix sp.]
MAQRKLALGLGLLLAVSASFPLLASAQTAPPSPAPYPACTVTSVPAADSERAHTIYAAGKVQYDDGLYDAAIAQFREAYKRDCTKHDLLIIISRAYEFKGDRAEAIHALQTYLERVPNSPEAGTHRTRIDNLKKKDLEAQQAAHAAAATASPPPATTSAPPPAEQSGHTAFPWIVVAAGGAAILTGVILHVAAPPFPENCDRATDTCAPLPNESAAAAQTRRDKAGQHGGMTLGGTIAIIGGIGIVGGGLLWHFLEPSGTPSSESGKPKLRPEGGPGYAGFSLGGAF